MKLSSEQARDLVGGLVFLAVGALSLQIALGYDLGTARRTGPGYFPALISIAIMVLSLVLVARALARAWRAGPGPAAGGGGRVDGWSMRAWTRRDGPVLPMLAMLAAALLFALLLDRAGLLIATAVLVLVAASVGTLRLRAVLALALILSIGSVLIFALALGQQLPVFGSWF